MTGTVPRLLSEHAPEVVVLAGPPELGLIATTTDHRGVAVHPNLETLETERHLFRLILDKVEADSIDANTVALLELLATVLLCADTVGAVGRAVQIVTEYLVQREAFGAPIASFQVVQHRLVDLTLFQSASEALVLSAAGALALGEPRAERVALAAHTYIESRAVAPSTTASSCRVALASHGSSRSTTCSGEYRRMRHFWGPPGQAAAALPLSGDGPDDARPSKEDLDAYRHRVRSVIARSAPVAEAKATEHRRPLRRRSPSAAGIGPCSRKG